MQLSNKEYNRKFVTIATCLGCGFFGISMYFWGAMLPVLGADIEGVNSLPWLLTLGIIIGTIVCGVVMDRRGYKWLLILSSLAIAIGLLIFTYSKDFYLLVLSAILIGGGGGVLNSETIAIISDIYDDSKRGAMLSVIGGSYCLGSLIWTIICRLWVSSPHIPVFWSSIVLMILSLSFIFIKFPKAKISKTEDISLIDTLSILKTPVLIIASFVLFFQGMVEAVSANYSTSYLTHIEGGVSKEIALTSLIILTVGMTIGRFSLPLFIRYLGNKSSLVIFLILAFIGALIQKVYPTSPFFAIFSMGLIGWGTGATSPIVFNYMGQIYKKNSGLAVSIVVLVAQVGMLIGNYGVGKLFNDNNLLSGNFKFFPILMMILIIVVIFSFPFVVRSVASQKGKNLNY